MQTVQIQANPKVYDPLAAFQTAAGKAIFQLFLDGATLKVWRHTTPHSWWLEHADGREYHWETNRKLQSADVPSPGLLVRLATNVGQQGLEPVSGLPSQESWQFNPQALAAAKQLWDHAQDCTANWEAAAGTFTGGALDGLSPLAQSTVLTLRSKTEIPMRGELRYILEELNAAGLLKVLPEGYARLKVPAKSLTLPKGKALKLERIKTAPGLDKKAA